MYQIPLGAWGWSWVLPIRLEVFVMSAVQAAVVTDSPVVVAVDVGKKTFALSVTDAGRHRLLGPVDFEMTGRGIARHGYPAYLGDTEAGAVTSGSYAPFLQKNIGLVYLPAPKAAVGTEFDVEIRGKRVPARVVPTPFYKRPR